MAAPQKKQFDVDEDDDWSSQAEHSPDSVYEDDMDDENNYDEEVNERLNNGEDSMALILKAIEDAKSFPDYLKKGAFQTDDIYPPQSKPQKTPENKGSTSIDMDHIASFSSDQLKKKPTYEEIDTNKKNNFELPLKPQPYSDNFVEEIPCKQAAYFDEVNPRKKRYIEDIPEDIPEELPLAPVKEFPLEDKEEEPEKEINPEGDISPENEDDEDYDEFPDWPDEINDGMVVGDEQWKAWMDTIIYKNPYQEYVPQEYKEPHEMIWEVWDRLDYQEGRWVDEDSIVDPYGPDPDGATVHMTDLQKSIDYFNKIIDKFQPKKPEE